MRMVLLGWKMEENESMNIWENRPLENEKKIPQISKHFLDS